MLDPDFADAAIESAVVDVEQHVCVSPSQQQQQPLLNLSSVTSTVTTIDLFDVDHIVRGTSPPMSSTVTTVSSAELTIATATNPMNCQSVMSMDDSSCDKNIADSCNDVVFTEQVRSAIHTDTDAEARLLAPDECPAVTGLENVSTDSVLKNVYSTSPISSPHSSSLLSVSSSCSMSCSTSCPTDSGPNTQPVTCAAAMESVDDSNKLESLENTIDKELNSENTVSGGTGDRNLDDVTGDKTFSDEPIEFSCNLTFDMMDLGLPHEEVRFTMRSFWVES